MADEVRDPWGLLWIHGKIVKIVKPAIILNPGEFNQENEVTLLCYTIRKMQATMAKRADKCIDHLQTKITWRDNGNQGENPSEEKDSEKASELERTVD